MHARYALIPTVAVLLGALVGPVAAQHGGGPGSSTIPGVRPELMASLAPPRLVLRYQTEIGLTDAQRKAISKIIAEAQAEIVDLRWQAEAESRKFQTTLDRHPVDVAEATAQAETIGRIEQQIKQKQLKMLLLVKNELTGEQFAKLQAFKPSRPRHRPPAPPQQPGATPAEPAERPEAPAGETAP
jgi:Spy/CpxP family protein refolding chaperone